MVKEGKLQFNIRWFGLIQHIFSQGEEITLLPVAMSLVRDEKCHIKSKP